MLNKCLVIAAVVFSPCATFAADSTLQFAGYLDFRYTNVRQIDGATESGTPESGFGLEEGAFYATFHHSDTLELFFDIPFRRVKTADDLNPGAGTASPQASNSNGLVFGYDKAQAYARVKTSATDTLSIGQFDTMFGFEPTDSTDRLFMKTSLVGDYLLPTTHTGVLYEHKFGALTGKAFIANPANKGSNGDASVGGDQAEGGLAFCYCSGNFRAAGGGSIRSTRRLLDFVGGTTLGKFNFDFELTELSDTQKNVYTPDDSSDVESPGRGYALFATYVHDETLSVYGRYERITDAPTNDASFGTVASGGLGLNYHIGTDIKISAEFVRSNFTKINGEGWRVDRWTLGTVYSF